MTSRVSVSSSGHELSISDVQYEDAGIYECEGRNSRSLGPLRRRFVIRVECKYLHLYLCKSYSLTYEFLLVTRVCVNLCEFVSHTLCYFEILMKVMSCDPP